MSETEIAAVSAVRPVARANAVRGCAIGLALLVLANAIFNPGFLHLSLVQGHLYGSPIDIFNQGSRIMLASLGMTLVIATGGVDLSVGSVVAISGAVCAILLGHNFPLTLVLAAAISVGAAAGAINAALVAGLGIQPIVATLILMVAGRGVAQLISNGEVLIIHRPSFAYLANGYIFAVPFAPLLALALYAVTRVLLTRTALGLFLEATGDNPVASRFAGVPARAIQAFAYVFSGACAGLVGALAASNIGAADSFRAGENLELDAIFAVVVGGTALTGGRFQLWGSLLGAIFLQTLTVTMYNFGVAPAVAPVPKAVLIVALALLQSERVRTSIKRRVFLRRSPS